MKLLRPRVQLFRNILDSTDVEIQPDVTCLVGKNESGKTAFLQALYRLKPARQNAPLSVPDQYPAWLEKRHRQEGKKLEDVTPISVTFGLEPADVFLRNRDEVLPTLSAGTLQRFEALFTRINATLPT